MSSPNQSTSGPTVAILGANGDAGRAIASELVATGHRILAVTRSGEGPPGTEPRAADLTDRAATVAAVGDAEVIVNAAQPGYPDWLTTFGGMVDNAIAAAEAHGARLIMIDNLYGYAPASGPISERSPEHATDPKGRLRVELGRRILDAHASGRINAVLCRQSDFYGPGAHNSALWVTGIANGLKGRTMRGLFDLDQPHSFAYLPDTARAVAAVVANPVGDGRAFVLPSASAITQRAMFKLINAQLPRPVKVGVISPTMMRLGGLFSRQIAEARSVQPQFDRPWITDASEFEATFGPLALTDHPEAVAATVGWEQ